MLQTAFYQRLAQFKPQLTALLDVPEPYLAYALVIRLSVVVNVLVHWIQTGKLDDPETLAAGLNEMAGQMRASNLLL